MTYTIPSHRRRLALASACTGIALAALAALAVTPASAATSKELLNCQKTIESQVRGFASTAIAKISTCTDKIVQCKLAAEIDAADPTACLAAASSNCSGVPAKVADQQSKRVANIVKKCGLIPLGELEAFVAGLGFFNVVSACGSATASQLAACVVADARCNLERAIFRLDPRAQDSLSDPAINLAGSFSCVAP
jgi:hypothetical protein